MRHERTQSRRRRPPRATIAFALVFAASVAGAYAGQQASPTAIIGQVVDAVTGRPLAGALVELRPHGRTDSSSTIGLLADSDGRFRFATSPDTPYSLSASHPGYEVQLREFLATASVAGSSTGASAPLHFELIPHAVVSGRVTDPSGQPLEDVVVSAVPVAPGSAEAPGNARGARTNDLGDYRLDNLPPGRYRIVVRVRHHTQAVGFRESAGLGTTGRPPQSLVTSSDGRFFKPIGLPPAPAEPGGATLMYVSTAFPSTSRRHEASILTIGAGDQLSGIDIQMHTAPMVRVSGVARGPGGPLASTVIDLFPADVPPEEWEQAEVQAETAPDGTFVFLGVPPGAWELQAYRYLGRFDVVQRDPLGLYARTMLTVGEQDIDNLDVALTPGTTLRSTFEFNGASPRPERVAPRLDLRTLGFRRILGPSEPTIEDQGFVISGLTPGEYTLTARTGTGWAVESVRRSGRDITGQSILIDGHPIDDVVVTLTDRPTRLAGRVARDELAGLPTTSAVAFSTDRSRRSAYGIFGEGLTALRLSLEADGSFQTDLLPPGEYFVVAVSSARMFGWPAPDFLRSLEASAERVLLQPGTTQTVTVRVVR